jgi:hypothetical protein
VRFKPRPALAFWSHHRSYHQPTSQASCSAFIPGSALTLKMRPRLYSIVLVSKPGSDLSNAVGCFQEESMKLQSTMWLGRRWSKTTCQWLSCSGDPSERFDILVSRSCCALKPTRSTSHVLLPERTDWVLMLLVKSSSAACMPFACVADEDCLFLYAGRVGVSEGGP